MKRRRNMAQMKGQIKTLEKDLNKMEISNLSDAEFKTLVIRMLKKLSENFNSIKKIQSETKDTPEVPSFGGRGGCATGPYRTPTTLGHATKTRSQSSTI